MRIRQAGNVWIKIADYGISQVSTGLTLRVGTSPVGTPGFMAPELFDKVGQEISSEKVCTEGCVHGTTFFFILKRLYQVLIMRGIYMFILLCNM